MSSTMSSSTLPVLPLQHPLILLPTGRITYPVSKSVGEALLALVRESDEQPLVAAVPQTAPEASLYQWGTASRIIRLIKPATNNLKQYYLLSLNGITRVRVLDSSPDLPVVVSGIVYRKVEYPRVTGAPAPESVVKFKAAALKLLEQLSKDTTQQAKRDSYNKVSAMVEEVSPARAAWMADVMVSSINGEYADKLEFLPAADPDDRLRRATTIFIKQSSISEVSKRITQSIDESLSKQQKEFFLRQQLAAIRRELANLHRSSSPSDSSMPDDGQSGSISELDDDGQGEVEEMAEVKAKIEAMAKDSDERKMAVREWKRLKRIPQGSVEHGVIRNYLEWLVSIPWPNSSTTTPSNAVELLRDRKFLKNAREQLDSDHFGLEKIKKRLIEYLAVVRLKALQAEREVKQLEEVEKSQLALIPKGDNSKASVPTVTTPPNRPVRKIVKGPILLFVGPPGTGKTSLGQSIARALGRPFQRISLGGVRDEAEIRGHRRTYVASGPGMIVQALRKAGRADPVILLDEIDKVGQSNFHGDPAAALLEVLDPEQNHTFNDHYINVPIDLSQVLFICTSNTLDTISAPLLDRCEIVQLSGYTYTEKMHISRKFLLPKQLQANGLASEQLTLPDSSLLHIATRYTREAGVRSLERAIGAVVRFKAVEWAEHMDSEIGVGQEYKDVVEEDELEGILGVPRWDVEEREREERRGVVYGLVVTGMGEGGTLPVETIAVPGSGKLKLTGSLGDVIKESGELALSWVKTNAYNLCITNTRSQDPLQVPSSIDIHLHLPSGAVKKDGPSAGIAMTCAFVSLLTGACVPSNIAMTGEITLRGRVGAVGGIKEKVLGAHRANITKVILPWANRKDVDHDVPPEVSAAMDFAFVRTLEEALEAAFGKGALGWRPKDILLESRL